MKAKKKTKEPLKVKSGDYYMDNNGLMVFTAQYHLRRGSCCHNGCRHCPYGSKKDE